MFTTSMRKILFASMMCVIACVMTGCLDNVKSDYTPEIYVTPLYVNPYYVNDTLHARDTLQIHYDAKAEKNVSDTIQLGDTVMVGTIFYSAENNLVATRIEWDSTAVRVWPTVNAEIKKALSDTTNIDMGILLFNPGYNMVSYPIYFVPQKTGSHSVKITVESDSKYSPVSVSFDLRVD